MGTSLNGLTPAGTYPGLIKTGDNAPIDGTLKPLSDGNGNNLPMAVSTTTINLTGTAQVGGVAIANTTQLAAKQDTLVSGTNIKTINGTSVLGSGNIVTPTTSPSGVSGAIQFSNGSAFASDATNFFWDNTNKRLGVGTNAPNTTAHFKGGVAGAVGTRIATLEGSLPEIWFKDTSDNTGFAITRYGGIVYFTNTNSSGGYSSYSGLTNSQGQWSFGGGFNPSAQVHIKGSGSTSATTSLLVQNSGGTNWLQVKDDGDITNGANGSTELKFEISPVANKFFRLTRQGTNVDFYSGNGGNACIQTSGGEAFSLIASSAYLTLSNGGVSVGATFNTTNASAILDVTSTTKGFLPPRMTTTQKNAIASPAAGLVVYDSTTNKLQCYNGSTWNDLF